MVFDDGPGIGLGHRRRMEALASALGAHGVECRLRATDLDQIDDPFDDPVDLVVVDSYLVRADGCPRDGARIVAVDDLERDLAVDVVIDPCPGADPQRHRRAGLVLAGSRFALLGADVAAVRPRPVVRAVRKIVVTMGGAGGDLASALTTTLAASVPAPTVVRCLRPEEVGVNGIATDLADADVVVTAGGVTMLESLALGRPTVTVVTAENQRRQVEGAAAAGAVVVVPADGVERAVTRIMHDLDERRALASAAVKLVDSHGAERVAACVLDD